jgi:hypothetical protein
MEQRQKTQYKESMKQRIGSLKRYIRFINPYPNYAKGDPNQ